MTFQIIEIDTNKETNLIFKTKQLITTPGLEPLLELYKGKLFSYLIKIFINLCIDQFGTQIFSIKKSFTRTISNILSCWMFSLYISYDFSNDYL